MARGGGVRAWMVSRSPSFWCCISVCCITAVFDTCVSCSILVLSSMEESSFLENSCLLTKQPRLVILLPLAAAGACWAGYTGWCWGGGGGGQGSTPARGGAW